MSVARIRGQDLELNSARGKVWVTCAGLDRVRCNALGSKNLEVLGTNGTTVVASISETGELRGGVQNVGYFWAGTWVGSTNFAAVYFATDPTTQNAYSIIGDGTSLYLNAPNSSGKIYFNVGNVAGGAGLPEMVYGFGGLTVGRGLTAPVARFDVQAMATGEVAGVFAGFSAGQTADLIQARKSDNTVVASVAKDGGITANPNNAGFAWIGTWVGGSGFGSVYLGSNPATSTAYSLIANGTDLWVNAPSAGGHLYFALGNSGGNPDLTYQTAGLSLGRGTTAPAARIDITSKATGELAAIIRGFAGQTADLLQLRKSDETVLHAVDAAGRVAMYTATAPTAAAGKSFLWKDANDDLYCTGADGTVTLLASG